MARRLILASGSPRRRELLASLGVPFEVAPSGVDEEAIGDHLPPDEQARTLASAKARDVWERLADSSAVSLGADTVVAVDADGAPLMLAKPRDAEEARRMLEALSGRPHMVFTGVAVVGPSRPEATAGVVGTQVRFRPLSADEIEAYVATGEPFDKAGGYGIQGGASSFVEAVYGDYYNVVGLPLAAVRALLLPRFPHAAEPPPAPPLPFAVLPARAR